MAKKKSKRFIIPSFHFLTTSPQVFEPANPAAERILDRGAVSNSDGIRPKAPIPGTGTKSGQTPQTLEGLPQQSIRVEESQTTQKGLGEGGSVEKPSKSVERPKPLRVNRNERRNSALSLSSLKRNKKEEEERIKKNKEQREQEKDLPKDPFTEGTFLEVWNTYVNDLHTKGEKILASILKADAPKLVGSQIHVTYPNELMKVELLKVRPKVLRHIRKELNNYEVDFEISVNEDTTKRFAYTPQEKYELLKEKNEAISLLRKKFNLEL